MHQADPSMAAMTSETGGPPQPPPRVEFDGFYRQRYPQLLRSVVMMGASPDQAEEVCIEAFTQMYKRWEKITYPLAYVNKLVWSLFLKLKKEQRQRDAVERLSIPEAMEDKRLIVWEDRQWIEQLFSKLTQARREVMELALEGLEICEIAELLGKKEKTVRQNLRRARKRLQALLREQEWQDGSHMAPRTGRRESR